jgi:peptide/nickel transport system permease protein
VLFLVTVVVFTLVELAPGDMMDYFVSPDRIQNFSEQDLERLREEIGLSGGPIGRYVRWLGNILQGDFGYSYTRNEPVGPLVLRRAQNSLILMGTSVVIAVIIGVPLGVFIALRQYSPADITLTGLSFIGLSMPAFVSGIIAMYLFAIRLPIFPSGGMFSTMGDRGILDLLHHLVLPAGVLAAMHLSRFMRYTRFSMLEVISQDYMVTAQAKGLRRRIQIYRHALRNALIPVITVIGLSIPMVIVGAVFLETIFNWPGMGRLYYNAVIARDYPVIMGANLLIALVVLGANLVIDIIYSVVDPRVRYD